MPFEERVRLSKEITLTTYDFGAGYRRVDVEPLGIAIGEHLDEKGNYLGYSFSVRFDFKLIAFLRKLKEFLNSKLEGAK